MNPRIAGPFFLALLILTLAAVPASAQDESPLHFGVKLGINISDFRGDDGVEGFGELLDWKLGFCGGVFMSYEVNEWFSLEPEIFYSMKGMKIGIFDFSATWSLDYIDVPVLAVFRLPFWESLEPFACAGPSIGFNVRSNISASYLEEELGAADLSDYTNAVDFSLVIGAGVNFGVGGHKISLEGRWVPGLTSVYNDDITEATGGSIEQFNDTFSFLLGYAF